MEKMILRNAELEIENKRLLDIVEKFRNNNKTYCKKYSKTKKGKEKSLLSSRVYYWKRIKKQYHPDYNADKTLL